jgi:hypothetical protein
MDGPSIKASLIRTPDAIIRVPAPQVMPGGKDRKMQSYYYRADSRLVPPVIITMGLGAFLLVLEGATKRGLLLFLVLAPFYYLGAEILARRIVLSSEGITVQKFLRSVHVGWREILSLDAFQSGSKLFIILQPDQGRPVLISNTIRPFNDLLGKLQEMVPAGKISETAREIFANPPSKNGPVLRAWLVCLVVAGVLAGRLLGYG